MPISLTPLDSLNMRILVMAEPSIISTMAMSGAESLIHKRPLIKPKTTKKTPLFKRSLLCSDAKADRSIKSPIIMSSIPFPLAVGYSVSHYGAVNYHKYPYYN